MTIYEVITTAPEEDIPEVVSKFFNGVYPTSFYNRPASFCKALKYAQRDRLADILNNAFDDICPLALEQCPTDETTHGLKTCYACIAEYLDTEVKHL